MNRFYWQIAIRAGHLCEYCQAPEKFFNFAFEVEHIVPPFLGGLNNSENLALACRSCNLFKSKHLTGTDENGSETERLFNPRTDVWTDHFSIDRESQIVEGLSEIGRGTIVRLRMNSEMQVSARFSWSRVDAELDA